MTEKFYFEPVMIFGSSENAHLNNLGEMSLYNGENEIFFQNLLNQDKPGYDKTDVTIIGTYKGKNFEYQGRFDIGCNNETDSMIDHIKRYYTNLKNHPEWNMSLIHKGQKMVSDEAIEEVLSELVPYLEKHNLLSGMLKDWMTKEDQDYNRYLQETVDKARKELNQGNLEITFPMSQKKYHHQ